MRIPFRVRSDRCLVVLRIHVDYETEKKPPPEAVVRIRRADIGEDGLYFLQQRRRSNAPLASRYSAWGERPLNSTWG